MKEIDMLFEHYESLANKYGNKHDEWKVDSLKDDVERVKKRYEEISESKKRIKRLKL
ncbi:MAG: hypothetical protein GTN97_03565 [Nitrosopumilaceae archaeon]|nr:hypothetical protein [Nitrosopumilaceae archaeon]